MHVCAIRYGGFEFFGFAVENLGHLFVAKSHILLIQERPASGSIFVGKALDEILVGDEMRGDASIPANHAALEDLPAWYPVFEIWRPFQFLIDQDSTSSNYQSTAAEGFCGADVIVAP